jgi:ABC-type nitrate/sulfonate/bicarbonate transport system substrate-binding protein
MHRRWLLVTMAVLLTLVAIPTLRAEAGPDAQKGLRTLRMIVFTSADAATAVAQARGFFAAEGLDVEVIITPNSTVQMRGLGTGEFDIASTAFDNVLYWSGREGAEIVAVVQRESRESIELPVYARPEIQSWEDLRGKRLAADAVDTAFALVLRRVLQEHGLDMDRGDYELVAVGATGPRLDSMRAGETFAAILSPPWDQQGEAAGMRRLATHRDVIPNYPGSVFAVSRAWAARNQDALVGFLRAWLAGLRWANENPEVATDVVAANLGVSRDVARLRLGQLPRDAALDVDGLRTSLDLRTRFNFTPPMGDDVTRYYDLAPYRQATGR